LLTTLLLLFNKVKGLPKSQRPSDLQILGDEPNISFSWKTTDKAQVQPWCTCLL